MYPPQPEPESKLRETLRYIGYTIGAVIGIVILGLLVLFLGEIIQFLLDYIFALICIIGGILMIISGAYLILKAIRNKE